MFCPSHHPVTVTTLSIDILHLVLGYLDPHSLTELSQTCRLLHRMVRHELNFATAVWYQRYHHRVSPPFLGANRDRQDSMMSIFHMSGNDDDDEDDDIQSGKRQDEQKERGDGVGSNHSVRRISTEPMSTVPPVYHLRCMALIGQKLFMPFMTMDPVCFVYEIERNEWYKVPLQACPGYTSIISPVVAVGHRLYLVGGRKVATGALSNEVHVIDTETWSLERLALDQGPLPRPRCDHTVDVLHNRFLLVFGGVCAHSLGENDLLVFDTETNTWSEPMTSGQLPTVRFGHASAMLGDKLYIFGGCETQAEGYLVHDILYKLDCRTWTWFKYDHPEAYPYRRRILGRSNEGPGRVEHAELQREQAIADSLRRDSIVETTGHPPRDRFGCVLQPVGPHKLLVFGGQTIRQDGDDQNVLHAHSLRCIDVFDLRRNHWSVLTTSSHDVEGSVYPHDVSSFLLNGQQEGYRLLVVGQQKAFVTTTTDSSGDSMATSPAMTEFPFRMDIQRTISPSWIPRPHPFTYHPHTPAPASYSAADDPASHPPQQRRIPVRDGMATEPGMYTLGRGHVYDAGHSRLSRAMADYEGFLELNATSEEDSPTRRRHHHHNSISSNSNSNDSLVHRVTSSPSHESVLFASLPTVASGSSPDTRADEHHISRQYTLEPLCIFLALNQE